MDEEPRQRQSPLLKSSPDIEAQHPCAIGRLIEGLRVYGRPLDVPPPIIGFDKKSGLLQLPLADEMQLRPPATALRNFRVTQGSVRLTQLGFDLSLEKDIELQSERPRPCRSGVDRNASP